MNQQMWFVEDDLIFKLDEDQISEINNSVQTNQTFLSTQSLKNKQRSPSKSRTQSVKQRHVSIKDCYNIWRNIMNLLMFI